MSDICGVVHDEYPEVRCVAPQGNHQQHMARREGREVYWPNDDAFPVQLVRDPDRLKDIAREVREAQRDERALARNDDPWSSHLAAQRIYPKLTTRWYKVLALLQERAGQWVSGTEIATPEVGGSEGLRRLRQLRKDYGWPIERRPDPASATAWQYRLPENF